MRASGKEHQEYVREHPKEFALVGLGVGAGVGLAYSGVVAAPVAYGFAEAGYLTVTARLSVLLGPRLSDLLMRIQGVPPVRTPSGRMGYAPGTASDVFVKERLQHSSSHLIKDGILPNWSKATGERFKEMGIRILENPIGTLEKMQGEDLVKGYLGKVDGHTVVVFVYETGQMAGQVCTSYVPSVSQLANWTIQWVVK